jgi:hypothetical protein
MTSMIIPVIVKVAAGARIYLGHADRLAQNSNRAVNCTILGLLLNT